MCSSNLISPSPYWMFEDVWLESDCYCSSCSSLLPGSLTAWRRFWSWRREKLSISLCPGAGSLSWRTPSVCLALPNRTSICSVRSVVYASLKKCIGNFFVLSDIRFFIVAADEVAWRLSFHYYYSPFLARASSPSKGEDWEVPLSVFLCFRFSKI